METWSFEKVEALCVLLYQTGVDTELQAGGVSTEIVPQRAFLLGFPPLLYENGIKQAIFLLFCFTRAASSRIIELTGELKHFCAVLFYLNCAAARGWKVPSILEPITLEVKWQK
jgi:hypothetical protein